VSQGLLAPWLNPALRAPGPVHVVGASGAEGVALLLFLAGELGIEGIVAHDFSADSRAFARSFRRANPGWERAEREAVLKRLLRLPIELRLGSQYLQGLGDAALVLASQNWFNYPSNIPALPDAIAGGSRLLGVVDLVMDLFPGVRLGVTGSNGKSTTAGLLAWILRAALPDANALLHGGNDRDAQVALADVVAARSADRLVWEVSNRHLRDRVVPVDVGVLTNVTRNHIEDHGSFEAYKAAKARLLHGVGPSGHVVLTTADPLSASLLPDLRDEVGTIWHAGASPTVPPPNAHPGDGYVWLAGDVVRIQAPVGFDRELPAELGRASTLTLPGVHNRQNLLSAVAAAVAGGARPELLAGAWATFPSMPGRLELVAEADGVRWVYDIQATTAPAAEAGIRAIGGDRTTVLVVGGEDKGMDYAGMASAARRHCRAIVALPGTGSDAFLSALGPDVPHVQVSDLDRGLAESKTLAQPGDTVLVSPGCAFFSSRFVAGRSFHRRVRDLLGAGAA
jgi:UDP-N-acetylmuramoylalanine--D-glutamate ligase